MNSLLIIQWGVATHKDEYIIHPQRGEFVDNTHELADLLQRRFFLAEYVAVSDRGTRVEILVGRVWQATHSLRETHSYLIRALLEIGVTGFDFRDYSNEDSW